MPQNYPKMYIKLPNISYRDKQRDLARLET